MPGKLELGKSVTPVDIIKKENEERSADCIRPANNSSEGREEVMISLQSDTPVMKGRESEPSSPTPDVDLGDLTEDQKIAVVTICREEADSFSKDDDDDVRCTEGLQLKINLSDNRPVQKNYPSIPKPRYFEVKQYAEDLLNPGWVWKSRSAYSSPVVCVRKRDSSLRLFVDFRELSRRTVPYRHPLP